MNDYSQSLLALLALAFDQPSRWLPGWPTEVFLRKDLPVRPATLWLAMAIAALLFSSRYFTVTALELALAHWALRSASGIDF
jgi:hypothetical protein